MKVIILALLVLDVQANASVAYLNLMRHGEKDPTSGESLSNQGFMRAQYYARCLGPWNPPSEALPAPTGNLMAQLNATVDDPIDGNVGLSMRSGQTLTPLATTMGVVVHEPCTMTDVTCFLREVQDLLQPGRTLIVCWEHKLFPLLLSRLEVPIAKHQEGTFNKWPKVCDADSWKDLRFPEAGKRSFPYHNACFDLIWQVKFVRASGGTWMAEGVTIVQAGFGGAASSPCAQGLASYSSMGESLMEKIVSMMLLVIMVLLLLAVVAKARKVDGMWQAKYAKERLSFHRLLLSSESHDDASPVFAICGCEGGIMHFDRGVIGPVQDGTFCGA